MPKNSCIMQIWAESGKSALPICNYSQILYQFLTFTQNLKRSLLNKILQEQSAFAIKDLAINGHDLIAIGLKPGPKFSRYLQKCLEAVMDGTCENNHDELLKFVVQLLMQETRNAVANVLLQL